MAFDAGKINAQVTLDSSEYKNELNKLPTMASQTFAKIGKFAAGAFAAAKIVAAVKDVIKTYMVQEDAVNNLTAALRNQGEEYNRQTRALMEYASQIQLTTKYGDETVAGIMTMGINMGITADKIKEATKAAVGLAGAYQNLSLDTAMLLIARAANGNTAMLTRYGIQLNASLTPQQKFNELLKKGGDMFKLAEAQAKTTSGRITQMSNAWGDLKEVMGQVVVELLTIRDASGNATNAIQELTNSIAGNVHNIVYYIKIVYYEFESGFKFLWSIVSNFLKFFWRDLKITLHNTLQLLTVIADAIVQWGKSLGIAIGRTFVILAKTVLGVLENLGNAVKNFGVALWDFATGGGAEAFSRAWEKTRASVVADANAIWRDTKKMGIDFVSTKSFKGQFKTSEGVRSFRVLLDEAERIYGEKLTKQAALEKWYAEQIAAPEAMRDENATRKALNGESDKEKGKEFDVVGNFSAAVLNAMLGRNTPAFQTAQNTKRMLELQNDIRRNGVKIKNQSNVATYQ